MMRFIAPVLTICLLTLLGCGGGGPQITTRQAPLDLSHRLPVDAALTGVVRLDVLGSSLSRALPTPLGKPITEKLAQWVEVVGIDATQDAWFAVSVGAPMAILRTVEDAERIVMEARRGSAPPGAELGQSSAEPVTSMGASSLNGWVAHTPLPPAWVHVRLVGAASGESVSLDSLSGVFGATQVIRSGDAADSVAAALETTDSALERVSSVLETHQIFRLLDASLPTIVTLSNTDGVVVVDLFQDQELGNDALVDALATRLGPAGASAQKAAASPRLGPLASGEHLRLYLDHRRWLLTTRALGEVVALQAVLSDGQSAARDEATFLRAARDAARLPERLMAPTLGVFEGTEISVSQVDGGLSGRVGVRYTDEARPNLSRLTGGTAPVAHDMAAKAAPVALTFALAPGTWGGALSAPVRPPNVTLSVLLQMIAECGFACVPAAWSTLPGFGLDLAGALGSIFPELGPMVPALRALGGATVVVRGDAKARTFAAALQAHRPDTRSIWDPLVEGMRAEWTEQGSSTTLLMGTSDPAYDALRATVEPIAVPTHPVLAITARGPFGPVFRALDIELRFDAEEMVLRVTGRESSP